ncbi:hypothetical protein A2962_02560 [Candidatus Woesebacteria bacterium RIFCSPLOWO2_01_FULL_39_61]|uniref:Uncharacterized protein n=1 Tax=Candidatus Woesebacteria bacterium RIFCSPHIGHO2_02_FULL_39_13 TaxID=1802505 RepID=A0A1F7YX25_9BACT|nr:MAG: hypothetical protein A2692_02125 [Candidatus Woesebacteria bacterium RIFCSPHIGHO2_01_FULL_39_95]OGM31780.1 MAG: hypothetical protein A3D01_04420 [Candidatus Woesebacteria bacterium RIFCSPHIGHO2_02_FULL_39_13]OGM36272.1 MAG: hypothetical protein A3E13_03510 [Candidatus Woesebacteria bacterium RIFCSPHIGHO2_12_FULL_40_20]OGM68680.1 MAG: hypothetical protein A2962_02560 [Candidatus Woesebacteria bacterium RIFCSPLOWO2_01_FULL_39_61]OGM72188.1 MAG: hypothetical protein A3H19_06465 [Candidatus
MNFKYRLPSKRKRFIISSFILSLGFIAIQLLPETYRFLYIAALGLLTLILFYWSLKEGLGKNATLITLMLPFYFTCSVGLFWFLLPTSLFTRVPIVILYGFGIYVLFLTANIYTVAAIRTIALMRAARGVGFVLTLLTFFLVFDTILSLRLAVYFISPIIIFASLPLYLQGFWSIPLDKKLSSELINITLVASLAQGEIAAALFFWPVSVAVGSLFLTVASYLLLGLGQAKLEGRLFTQTIREHLILGMLVFLGMFWATNWGN